MAFSTVGLFKVNLMPGGGVGPSDLAKVKTLLEIQPVESRFEDVEAAV